MGVNLPRRKRQKIEWVQARAPVWSADPAAIGLTSQQAAQVEARLAAARAAQRAAIEARAAALVATQMYTEAARALHTSAAEAIATIKSFAEASGDPGGSAEVYRQAMVSAPAGGAGPARRPAEVGAVTTGLRNDGAIELRWRLRAPTATGTRYFIHRRIEGETGFTMVADTARKVFIDRGVPAGSLAVSYFVVAKRGDFASAPSEAVTMPLGALPAAGHVRAAA